MQKKLKNEKTAKTGMGERIRIWRKDLSIKGYELAKMIRISQGSLSDIENNKSDPSAATIKKLLTLTDIDWVWLITGKSGDIKVGEMPRKDPALVIHVSPGSEFLIVGREST